MAAAKMTAGAPDKLSFSTLAKQLATDNGSSIVEGTNQVMHMIVSRDLSRQ